jgi:hypothetical protein
MSCVPPTRRRRVRAAVAVLAAVVAAACVQGCGPGIPIGRNPASTSTPPGAPPNPSLRAEINQFRDNYGKQVIEIQLTNTTSSAVTVLGAELVSPLFLARIEWQGAAAGTEIPPGQTKSLPARLPAASCLPAAEAPPPGGTAVTAPPSEVRITVLTDSGRGQERLPASDPFGVLARNNAEMCLAQDAAEVATIRLEPDLEVAADALTAVVRLSVIPRITGDGPPRRLTVERIEGTTLLAEPPGNPWPRGLVVETGGSPAELRLQVRPARCDPHAVAEDKVGTLLPVRVSVGARQGVLKVDAGTLLRGRLYDFVTAACGRH